ncbi:MAG TPA: hypothetical protein VFB99_00360, partial [Vicinamibacterales bacterium]|nr:hypothetical protein [Vicinamibacterales bacterium]
VGFNAWAGLEDAVLATQVTEWDEPQAVIGSYLHRYAYPDNYRRHVDGQRQLTSAQSHRSGAAHCVQLRGEYLFAAEGDRGLRVYDVANVANKGFSQRMVDAPFSKLGHDPGLESVDASCVALPTNQPIHPPRNEGELMRIDNMEQPFHPIYNYALLTDRVEGLILTDVNTFADGDLGNNFLERAATWNPDGILDGARHLTVGGHYVYVMADRGLVVVNLDQPLQPQLAAVVPLVDGRASALQFRFLFVTDSDGLKVVDVTHPDKPVLLDGALVPMNDAQRIYIARSYAYVAAGAQGLAIVDVWQPPAPKLVEFFDAGGRILDARDVVVGSTNASLFAYVADGEGGLKVLQLTSPESQPNFNGFSPQPRPELIAFYPTSSAALSLSKGLDRDRGVDETGGQIAVFGRKGARPLNLEEMQRLYLDAQGNPWYVQDE